jgi:hypothetical protein
LWIEERSLMHAISSPYTSRLYCSAVKLPLIQLKPGSHAFFFDFELIPVITETLLEPRFDPATFFLAS